MSRARVGGFLGLCHCFFFFSLKKKFFFFFHTPTHPNIKKLGSRWILRPALVLRALRSGLPGMSFLAASPLRPDLKIYSVRCVPFVPTPLPLFLQSCIFCKTNGQRYCLRCFFSPTGPTSLCFYIGPNDPSPSPLPRDKMRSFLRVCPRCGSSEGVPFPPSVSCANSSLPRLYFFLEFFSITFNRLRQKRMNSRDYSCRAPPLATLDFPSTFSLCP